MRILNRFFMIVSTGLLIFFTDFAPPSPILMYCVVGIASASYMCDRHLAKSYPTTMYLPGWTVYRVDGKVRLRRKADYKKIHEMELHLGIIETPKPTPSPRPSDSAYSARPGSLASSYHQAKTEWEMRQEKRKSDFHHIIMEDLAHAYKMTHPKSDPPESKCPICETHPMDEPYPVEIMHSRHRRIERESA